MSNKYALNYSLDFRSGNNSFSALWKLTRCMKAAGWTYKASGDGTTKDTTGTATNDRWGSNVDPMTDVYPATNIAQASGGQSAAGATINVLSTDGFPSSGRFNIGTLNTNVTYTGKTATSFTGCSGGSGTMVMGYTVTLLDTYAAWWCAEGPSTVKIGITAASSGTFLSNEGVSQAGSGATGEILGYVINSAANSGWLVIMPRTGTFNNSGVITGATSGATVTATSYNLIRRQVVFAKDTNVTNGWIFYEALSDTEIAASSNTALFSDLAANAANCTATVAPGNSAASNNLFPVYGISCLGTSGGGASTLLFQKGSSFGMAQIVAVNATPSAGVSADGTFWAAIFSTDGSVGTPSNYCLISFQRLDNTEPGDADPFIFQAGTTELVTSSTGRTQGTAPNASPSWGNQQWSSGTPAKGYCARTTGTMGSGLDVYSGFSFGLVQGPGTPPAIISNAQEGGSGWNTDYPRIRNHPDALTQGLRPIEMFSVIGSSSSIQIRKGVCRWLGAAPPGFVNQNLDNKRWLIVLQPSINTVAGNNPGPAAIIGPLDTTTTPVPI